MKFTHTATLDSVSTKKSHRTSALRGGRVSRPVARIVVLIAIGLSVWFAVTVPLKARFGRAPRVLSIGTTWSAGYVAIPHRSAKGEKARRADVAKAELLARQRGLPIVADTGAEGVIVIQNEASR